MIGTPVEYFWAGAPDEAVARHAWVVFENADKTVNVAGFDHNGALFSDLNVLLLESAPPIPDAPAPQVRQSWAKLV